MDRQAMMDLAQRIVHARDNDARAREVMTLASDDLLHRLGLAREPSLLERTLTIGGAIALGAVVGAGTALLLTPSTGAEMQDRLRTQAKRLQKDFRKVTDRVEQTASDVREKVDALTSDDSMSPRDGRQRAHA